MEKNEISDERGLSPLLEYDGSGKGLIEPSRHSSRGSVPERLVLCFMNSVLKKAAQTKGWERIGRLVNESETWPIYRVEEKGVSVGIVHPGIGAPLAAGHLEELIAMGCRSFIACGGAGSLLSAMKVGEVILVESAVRDEGLSCHYLPPGREVESSRELTAAVALILEAEGRSYRRAKTWTTDAFYRETPDRISRRRGEGCSLVEMECAALFAVAQYRKVRAAALLYAGDDCSGPEWESRAWQERGEIRMNLLETAIRCCAGS